MAPRSEAKKTSLVKTDIFGRTTNHNPKTGAKLKDKSKAKGQKLKKAGWF